MSDYPYVTPFTNNYIIARSIQPSHLDSNHTQGLQLCHISSYTTDDIECYDINTLFQPLLLPKLRVSWKDTYLLKSIHPSNQNQIKSKAFALKRNYNIFNNNELTFQSQYMPATIIKEPTIGLITIKYNNSKDNTTYTYPIQTLINNISIPTVIYIESAYNSIFYNNLCDNIRTKKRKFQQIISDDDSDDEIEILSHTKCNNNNNIFIQHMTMQQANNLSINDKFDHRDKFGRVFAAKVCMKKESNIFVEYEGWESKYNIWCDYSKELYRFSKYGSISRRPRHRFLDLNIGDFIDIKCKEINDWKYGEIKQLDCDSGQVQIVFENTNKTEKVYWVHLDNTNEVAVFATKSSSTQILLPNKKRKCIIDITDNNITPTKKKDENINILGWNSNDIYKWIISIDNKFEKYENLKQLLNEQEINGKDLKFVTEENIKNDFGIKKFSDKKLLFDKIKELINDNNKDNNNEDIDLKINGNDDNIPQQFLDPITYELMVDPVLCCKSGHTYERKTIEDWIDSNGADPITRQKIKKKHLTSNRTLKELIQQWKKTND